MVSSNVSKILFYKYMSFQKGCFKCIVLVKKCTWLGQQYDSGVMKLSIFHSEGIKLGQAVRDF